jgi:hypothetical protein
MKKLFVGLCVIAFTMSSFTTVSEKEEVQNCFDGCDTIATVVGDLFGLNHAQENYVFEQCLEQNDCGFDGDPVIIGG